MSTITLYSRKVNRMPSLIRNAKRSVKELKSEINDLRKTTATIDSSVCNLDDVIASLRSSTSTQEEKIEKLQEIKEEIEDFIDDVVEIDEEAAEAINQSKDDFYDDYYYLKPDSEKSGWEKFKDGCKKVGEWCKEHWKVIVTVVLVIAAVVCLFIPGVNAAVAGLAFGKLILDLAAGVLIGAVIGGTIGGVIGAISPNSTFLEGLENGAFGGAVGGLITGGLGGVVSSFTGAELTLAQSMLVGGGGDAITSIITDLGDIAFKGDNISFSTIVCNALFSFGTGALFSGLSGKLGELLPIKIRGLNKGRDSWKFTWNYELANVGRNRISLKAIFKGIGARFIDDLWDNTIEIFKGGTGEGWESYKKAVSA